MTSQVDFKSNHGLIVTRIFQSMKNNLKKKSMSALNIDKSKIKAYKTYRRICKCRDHI